MRKKITLFILPLLIFVCCNKEFENRCFEKQGDIKVDARTIDSFNRVDIWGVFDIELAQDTFEHIDVRCGENLFPYIETTVEENTLNIYEYVNCKWSREYVRPKVTVYFRDLIHLRNKATCNIYSRDTIYLNHITIYLRNELAEMDLTMNANSILCIGSYTTTGKYYLSGKCNHLAVEVYNATEFDFSKLIAKKSTVLSNSIGNVDVYVTDLLSTKLYNSGNIRLAYQPDSIDIIDNSGSGKIIPFKE